MKFLIFAASHRPESFNRKLAKLAAAYAQSQGITVDFAEYGEFDMPMHNATLVMPEICYSFAKRAASADGIVISMPEYNWSYPASLKNIIEWTSCINPYPLAGKTALLMSASPGSRGGVMGLHQLKTPLEESKLFVFPRVFPLGRTQQAFDQSDRLIDKKHQDAFTTLVDEYIVFTRKLSKGD